MKKFVPFLIMILCCRTLTFAEERSIAGLLDTIETTSDLSKKTKLENSGFSTIYTRTDLDMMHVKSLRDILKYSFDGYWENRYALPDPLTFSFIPFSSSLIRVFIDDHEITTSMYGSGLIIVGELDLGFADHIEVYSLSTSFVYSTEPTSTLIRIFSKKPNHDSGGSLRSEITSRNGSIHNIQYIGDESGLSYLARFSASNDERKTYATSQDDLNRDVKRYNVFTTLKTDEQSILINASKSDKGGWLGPSLDGSLDTSKIAFKDAHLSYSKQVDNVKLLLGYDLLKDHVLYEDSLLMYYHGTPVSRFESKSESSVLSSELKYTTQIEQHHIVLGTKYRYKMFEFDLLQLDGNELPRTGHTKQGVGSAFIEESYALKDNLIVTLGLQTSRVSNNGGVKDDTVQMARAGVTYTTDAWTSKSFIFHNESYVDPYLINSFYTTTSYPKNQIMDTVAQEIKYENDASEYEAFVSYGWIENMPFSNASGLVDTAEKVSNTLSASLRYTYNYGYVDKLSLAYMFQEIDHAGYQKEYRNHHISLRHQHRYQKLDLFEEIFLGRNEDLDSNGYDVTFGLRYHVSDDLSFTLKGQNLLGKAEKQSFPRMDALTFAPLESLAVPIQERLIVLGFEWLF